MCQILGMTGWRDQMDLGAGVGLALTANLLIVLQGNKPYADTQPWSKTI
jgi:hypothetical protein